MADAARIADSLTPLEQQLLLGECDRWGSWMFTAGARLCGLGLGTKRDGSIRFDTALAHEVIALLRGRRDQAGR